MRLTLILYHDQPADSEDILKFVDITLIFLDTPPSWQQTKGSTFRWRIVTKMKMLRIADVPTVPETYLRLPADL